MTSSSAMCPSASLMIVPRLHSGFSSFASTAAAASNPGRWSYLLREGFGRAGAAAAADAPGAASERPRFEVPPPAGAVSGRPSLPLVRPGAEAGTPRLFGGDRRLVACPDLCQLGSCKSKKQSTGLNLLARREKEKVLKTNLQWDFNIFKSDTGHWRAALQNDRLRRCQSCLLFSVAENENFPLELVKIHYSQNPESVL